MKTTKFLTVGALIAVLAAPAAAQVMSADWDTNADGSANETEFGAGFTGAGTMASYDTDGDSMISEEEYNTRSEAMNEKWRERDYEMTSFADSDANADGMLDEIEYNSNWFNTYDADRSGMIDEAEMGDMDTDMGEDGLFGS